MFIIDSLRLSFVICIRCQHWEVITDCGQAGHNNFLFLLKIYKNYRLNIKNPYLSLCYSQFSALFCVKWQWNMPIVCTNIQHQEMNHFNKFPYKNALLDWVYAYHILRKRFVINITKVYKHFRPFLHIYKLPPSIYKMLILFLKIILFPSPISFIIFNSLHCS